MDEHLLGGIIAIVAALPGVILGLAILIGKWRPAAVAAARDPERARVMYGSYVLGVEAMVTLLGIGLIALPADRMDAVVPYAAGFIVVVSLVGLVPLFRAMRT